MHFSTENISAALTIEPLTTYSDLIRVRAGATSVIGSYYAPGGVHLRSSTSFYIRSNLRTTNRNLRTLDFSSTIANISINKPHNELERIT